MGEAMSRHHEPGVRYESSGTSFFALLGAMGVGAALMYLFDPETGRRRRALVRDKYVHGKTVLQHRTEAAVHHAANQTRGAMARMQNRIATTPEQVVDITQVDNRLSGSESS
jgi:hypothetical protein